MTTPNTPDGSFHLDSQDRAAAFLAALPLVVQAINDRNEVRAMRLELQAIAKSNARIVALLERKFFSEGEPIRPDSVDSEARRKTAFDKAMAAAASVERARKSQQADSLEVTGNQTTGEHSKITHNRIGDPFSRWVCTKCGKQGVLATAESPPSAVEAEQSHASQPASSAPEAPHPNAGQAR